MTTAASDVGAIERLLALVAVVNSDLDLASVLRRISEAGNDLLDGDCAGVLEHAGDQLRILAVSGEDADRRHEGSLIPYEGSAVAALDRSGRLSMVDSAEGYPAIGKLAPRTVAELHTVAVARIVVAGQTRGALTVLFSEPGRTLSETDQRMLELLAAHAGSAVANAEAYAAVVRQQRHEHAVVDAMADGLAVVGEDLVVRAWNAAATSLTGLPAELAVGKPLPFPHTLPGIGFEYLLTNGRWVEVLSSPLDEVAEVASRETVVTFRDITAAKMADEAKDLFLATSGHELRTPLTVIRGFAGTLISRWDDLTDAERQEAVRIIGARADGLGVLVEQVLQSSHAEVGARRLERRAMHVAPALAIAAMDVGSLSSRHAVTVEVADDLPKVLADDQALRTILGHLMDNAVKYSPDGGLIALSAEVAEDGSVVRIRVDDEGIGVASEDEERVFERFFQADGGDTRRRGGFGLGLYIVRRLVQAHGGTVTMSRRPDGRQGSRLELCLPIAWEN
ncbi:MAG: two-component system, OmpR family, phosphate regulon sensor histidine kinase PhoR [Frankiales bacterium]|jgi:signal transduction histidine kinase|nr:two-component system, OmpR family, phosphate regulon sensor histidine kinase PhoR [Frankiales bacterium]